ncbi:hypothetical protein ACLK19_22700 [Escherichia coli]
MLDDFGDIVLKTAVVLPEDDCVRLKVLWSISATVKLGRAGKTHNAGKPDGVMSYTPGECGITG